MPGSLKIFLPQGNLGISFQGSPPVVATIQDDSPLNGKIKVGQVATTLLVPNELEMSEMSHNELEAALDQHSSVQGRVLTLTDKSKSISSNASDTAPPASTNSSKSASSSSPLPTKIYLQTHVGDPDGVVIYWASRAGTESTQHKVYVRIQPPLPVHIAFLERTLLPALKEQVDSNADEAYIMTNEGQAEVSQRRTDRGMDTPGSCVCFMLATVTCGLASLFGGFYPYEYHEIRPDEVSARYLWDKKYRKMLNNKEPKFEFVKDFSQLPPDMIQS